MGNHIHHHDKRTKAALNELDRHEFIAPLMHKATLQCRYFAQGSNEDQRKSSFEAFELFVERHIESFIGKFKGKAKLTTLECLLRLKSESLTRPDGSKHHYHHKSLTVSWSNDPYLLEKSQAPVQDWKILLLSSKNYEIFRSLMEKMYQQVYQEVLSEAIAEVKAKSNLIVTLKEEVANLREKLNNCKREKRRYRHRKVELEGQLLRGDHVISTHLRQLRAAGDRSSNCKKTATLPENMKLNVASFEDIGKEEANGSSTNDLDTNTIQIAPEKFKMKDEIVRTKEDISDESTVMKRERKDGEKDLPAKMRECLKKASDSSEESESTWRKSDEENRVLRKENEESFNERSDSSIQLDRKLSTKNDASFSATAPSVSAQKSAIRRRRLLLGSLSVQKHDDHEEDKENYPHNKRRATISLARSNNDASSSVNRRRKAKMSHNNHSPKNTRTVVTISTSSNAATPKSSLSRSKLARTEHNTRQGLISRGSEGRKAKGQRHKNRGWWGYARFDYQPSPKEVSKKLALTKGDVVHVLQETNKGWWYGTKSVNGTSFGSESGYFPAKHIQQCDLSTWNIFR